MNYIIIGTTAFLTFILCLGLHEWDAYRLEDKYRNQEQADLAKVSNQCEEQKKLTEGVANDFQTKLTAANNRLDALKRVRPASCVTVSTSSTSGGSHGQAGQPEHAGQNGVTSDALYDYAGQCEKYRLQVISLEDFITKAWALNDQGN